jgi:hypothetical protein
LFTPLKVVRLEDARVRGQTLSATTAWFGSRTTESRSCENSLLFSKQLDLGGSLDIRNRDNDGNDALQNRYVALLTLTFNYIRPSSRLPRSYLL